MECAAGPFRLAEGKRAERKNKQDKPGGEESGQALFPPGLLWIQGSGL
ncbi:hypothetical protein J27TS7_21220 [Paenibacillus dendritiformis]|nr:hypothetical protein J27TS7_21220 [Paenibacillus dendritiformis]